MLSLSIEGLQPCKAKLPIAGRIAVAVFALGAQLPAHAQRYAEEDYSGSFNILIWVLGIAVFLFAWLRNRMRHWWNPQRAEAEDKAAEERRQSEREANEIALDARMARDRNELQAWVEHSRRQTEAQLRPDTYQEFRKKLRLKNGTPLDE